MKVQPLPEAPLLQTSLGHAIPHAAWQTTALAVGMASLFILLLRSIGA